MRTKINKTKGFHEDDDPLLGKARIHSIVAQKNKFAKEQISDEVAISPADNEQEEKTLTLRFKDSNKFLDAVFKFQKKYDTTIQVVPILLSSSEKINIYVIK
jgi:hypothetical protein